jgi:hypothetical protein
MVTSPRKLRCPLPRLSSPTAATDGGTVMSTSPPLKQYAPGTKSMVSVPPDTLVVTRECRFASMVSVSAQTGPCDTRTSSEELERMREKLEIARASATLLPSPLMTLVPVHAPGSYCPGGRSGITAVQAGPGGTLPPPGAGGGWAGGGCAGGGWAGDGWAGEGACGVVVGGSPPDGEGGAQPSHTSARATENERADMRASLRRRLSTAHARLARARSRRFATRV